jgi:hypothetical protein
MWNLDDFHLYFCINGKILRRLTGINKEDSYIPREQKISCQSFAHFIPKAAALVEECPEVFVVAVLIFHTPKAVAPIAAIEIPVIPALWRQVSERG